MSTVQCADNAALRCMSQAGRFMSQAGTTVQGAAPLSLPHTMCIPAEALLDGVQPALQASSWQAAQR